MREGYTDIDAINRIFKMHGNAVIAIYNESNIFRFKLIDTQKYFLCGDLREATEVIEIIGNNKFGTLNLKKHGFLIYSDTIDNLKYIIKDLIFSYRR